MSILYLDSTAGFCTGVKRAIRGAYNALRNHASVVCLGEIIHNPLINLQLEKRGIRIIQNINEVNKKDHVIIRAHGIPPKVEEELVRENISYSDFTCPKVKRIHKAILDYIQRDYTIFIVGVPNHPETIGHIGYAGEHGKVISHTKELDNLFIDSGSLLKSGGISKKKYAVLAQTTTSVSLFSEIADKIKGINKNIEINNTICSSVMKQQDWIKKYARLTEASLIIGGKKSSNTKKLFEIAIKFNRSFWIEDPREITSEIFDFNTVAVTAGASTPDSLISNIIRIFKKRGVEIYRC
jgi:4-hydroxy-3-methylbut-2-enyl diphosphate reductase